ncbi:MAG: hypothetical protein U9Q83_01820 [Bacteroidota bacterium]|nr:hypothetical protein [Bacteroidota bacterium]
MEYFTKEEIEIINDNYGTALALNEVLKNMFNAKNYPDVDLQKCLQSDDLHKKLFYKILEMPIEYINGSLITKNFFTKGSKQ